MDLKTSSVKNTLPSALEIKSTFVTRSEMWGHVSQRELDYNSFFIHALDV